MLRKISSAVTVVAGFCALGMLLATTTFQSIGMNVCIGLALAVCFLAIFRWAHLEEVRNYKNLVPEVLIVMLLVQDFYYLWIVSSRVSELARRLHLSSELFIWLVGCILGIFAWKAIDTIWAFVAWVLRILIKRRPIEQSLKNAIVILLIIFLESLQMEYSVVLSWSNYLQHTAIIIAINYLIVALLNLLFILLLQNWKITLFISGFFFTVWSVVNYYVIRFHGAPLFPLTLYTSGKTGLEVAGAYRYSITYTVVCLFAIFLLELWLTFFYIKNERLVVTLKKWLLHLVSTGLIAAVLIATFLGKGGFLPGEGNGSASWNDTVKRYGFLVASVWDIKNHGSWLHKPDGYSTEKIRSMKPIENYESISEDAYPDIILILNETFCDLEVYTSIHADVDYMSDFYGIQGATYGYAVTPFSGGGTNDSEFELLTSKSVRLLSTGAPFTYFSRELESRSVVQYVESLGYTTTGMHCGGKTNYYRDLSYPALGFDNIYLGADAFKYNRKYGNRSWYDADNYRDLIEHYEASGEGPQFYFLLTLQNHGGFEQNEDSLDTVHTQLDFGSLTDDINEFLTSVSMSASAFRELTDYYSKVDRPVLICMVGDHAPPFVSQLEMDGECPVQDSGIGQRFVPYVMWSNYGVNFASGSEYAPVTDLVPLLFNAAGMPMSSFYKEVTELHSKLPIRTSDGLFMDEAGEIGEIDGSKYAELLQTYYMMAYNSLLETDEYREELFLP